MMETNYWNHNSAYYPWVLEKTRGCHRVLDVDCGNGELALLLGRDSCSVEVIDPSEECIVEAKAKACEEGVRFTCTSFDDFDADGPFDAIMFVASIHHMDMEKALAKTKGLLAPGGMIAVVGLASPSSALDHAIEVLRVVPSWMSSRLHRMRTSEDMGIPTSYELPTMAQVREATARLLPGAAISKVF